jgi:hypothetical protein
MNKAELIDLLVRLHDYMDDRSDADGDSEGYRPNEEGSFAVEISDMLYLLGQREFGSTGRASVDPNFRLGGLSLQENNSFDFKKFLKENKLTKGSQLSGANNKK